MGIDSATRPLLSSSSSNEKETTASTIAFSQFSGSRENRYCPVVPVPTKAIETKVGQRVSPVGRRGESEKVSASWVSGAVALIVQDLRKWRRASAAASSPHLPVADANPLVARQFLQPHRPARADLV